ncbi:DUF1186 domain-containing protein [Mesoterricola silvestris]|uniref:DUF1186 domain-containing protein n=1 Tax=Mesoterricola silvestris TaxID=2927979 RepID=A0AA48H5K9_9BACT|nr:DUF1186 domain-containing protein [Mesoterricola silvestris]BDU72273.1 hypothetical protein METEAL_14470 [Mesoterricola silvestris]
MTPSDILAELELPYDGLPEAALLEAMEQPGAVIPGLLTILGEAAADPMAYLDATGSNAHLYALYLLAQFREPRALEPLLSMLRLPADQQDALLGDLLTEGVPSLLASLCIGTPAVLEATAADPALDPYVRGAAMDALLVLSFQGHLPEDKLLRAFDVLLATFEARGPAEDPTAWAFLIIALETAGFAAFLPRLREALRRGRVDRELVDPDELEDAITRYNAHERRRFLLTHHLVEDALLSLEELHWPGDAEDLDEDPIPDLPTFAPEAVHAIIARQPYPKPAGTPAQNADCPCGSGKKYKRCCGKP